jgi:hypothetical protein
MILKNKFRFLMMSNKKNNKNKLKKKNKLNKKLYLEFKMN